MEKDNYFNKVQDDLQAELDKNTNQIQEKEDLIHQLNSQLEGGANVGQSQVAIYEEKINQMKQEHEDQMADLQNKNE